MSQVYSVAVVVGSLRKESYNRKVARALSELAPSSLALKIVEIGELPLYNEDIDQDSPPAAYSDFRSQLQAADALLFVTPEYNRSVPAPMKNAIDVGSRPYGKSAFSGKPGAVLSASPGAATSMWMWTVQLLHGTACRSQMSRASCRPPSAETTSVKWCKGASAIPSTCAIPERFGTRWSDCARCRLSLKKGPNFSCRTSLA